MAEVPGTTANHIIVFIIQLITTQMFTAFAALLSFTMITDKNSILSYSAVSCFYRFECVRVVMRAGFKPGELGFYKICLTSGFTRISDKKPNVGFYEQQYN